MNTFDLTRGASPLIVSIPHDGREIPDAIATRLTDEAKTLPDTDWHVRRLYSFLEGGDATVIAARLSRFVVDLNRPPDDEPLYPSRWGTSLVPTRSFHGYPLYRGPPPTDDEIEERRARYWEPYHTALAEEIDRVVARHGFARLWDAHSIPGVVPSLFEGELPELNLGTADGRACRPEVADAVWAVASSAEGYRAVRDGRFKGGYITRHYGRPDAGIDALQLELVQRTYMHEGPPHAFDEGRANRVRPVLRAMLERFSRAELDGA